MSSWLRKMYNVFGSCNKWTRFWWALWDYLIITVFCVLICTREFTRVDLPKSSLYMLTSRNKPSYILWTFRQNFFSASWLQHNQHTIQINSVGIMLVMWIDVLFKYLKKKYFCHEINHCTMCGRKCEYEFYVNALILI